MSKSKRVSVISVFQTLPWVRIGYNAQAIRRLFSHILLALSLLLCAAVAGMWVRSFWSADYLYYTVPEERDPTETVTKQSVSYGVLARRGVLQLEWLTNTNAPGPFSSPQAHNRDPLWSGGCTGRWVWGAVSLTDDRAEELLRLAPLLFPRGAIGWREPASRILQFGYERILYNVRGSLFGDPPGICRLLTVPHWAIGLPGLVFPLLTLSRAQRRRRREARGLCVDCGYDLRATPARCPECGREAASVAS